MKLGIICDLHLGHQGIGRWHNRVMFDHAVQITQKTISLLNGSGLDGAIILGDITHNGTKEECSLAYDVISRLTCPWLILPGNHDRPAVQSGLFQKQFKNHLPPLYNVQFLKIPSIFLYDHLSAINSDQTALGDDLINQVMEKVENQPSANLFIFSHIPLISQKEYADRFQANYVPHYSDGQKLINQLSKHIPGRIFSFCGHEHWHHMIDNEKHFFCATAALIEYPMQARIITIENNRFMVNTLDSACPDIAKKSLDSARWVTGSKTDRDYNAPFGRRKQ